ncbi:MAG: hypothetical protein LBL59_08710 [Xanthomonadaceae bacterium]|jgi:hypothetical protein|nr:hypothetical protein [Xanthomonadaceae bacterium]
MAISDALALAALNAVKSGTDGGNLYLFNGPVPVDPDDALDMETDHTQLVKMTLGGDGSTGLTWGDPVGNVLPKPAGTVWEGLIAFDGAQAAQTSLSATFFRFCAAGDDGRGAGTTMRIQGTVGGPTSAADLILDNGTLTAGANTQGVGIFSMIADA